MNSNFEKLSISIYGESHAPEIGVRLGGIPDGCELNLGCMYNLLGRRRSAGGLWATARREKDEPIIVSGLKRDDGIYYQVDGDIDIAIRNENVRPHDYSELLSIPRPSHADYAAYAKDGKLSSGGGRFSGRMTAPLCMAGGIAQELLEGCGIKVCAYISSIGKVKGASYKTTRSIAQYGLGDVDIRRIKDSAFPVYKEDSRQKMQDEIREAAGSGDSVGGTVECVVTGLEPGMLGDALFEGLEGKIAYSVYAIPAVKGVEFGAGFDIAKKLGSQANDNIVNTVSGIMTETNNSGGINGGISNGMPLTLRVAFRPTPSISKQQTSVDLSTMQQCLLSVKGRHDACIVPRAVPCVEAAVSIALLDEVLKLRERIAMYQGGHNKEQKLKTVLQLTSNRG